MRPPRALQCDFPLGRPLGKPNDPAFQRRVLDAAFALLEHEEGPVLETFPETIEDRAEMPASCPLPPRHDPDLHPAVDEAQALRPAYDRSVAERDGRTLVGRVVGPDDVPDAVAAFARVADGTPWKDAGIPGNPIQVAHDIRSYYEEAALALADHVPEARATESWFFQVTEAGKAVGRAQQAMSAGDSAYAGAFYLRPATQPPPPEG